MTNYVIKKYKITTQQLDIFFCYYNKINVKKTFPDTDMTSLGPHIALLISNVAIGMDTHLVKMTVATQHVVANQ